MIDITKSLTVPEPTPTLGFWYNQPADKYHSGPGIGSHHLQDVLKSPLHYRYWRDNPRPPSPAMEFGTAFHTLILEPEIFATSYDVVPERPANAKGTAKKGSPQKLAYEQWKAASEALEASDVIGLTVDEWNRLHGMRDAVMSHTYAAIMLDPDAGPCEVTNYWIDEDSGALCRARFDKLNEAHGDLIVDLKTSRDASLTGATRAVSQFGYYLQAALYLDGYRATTGRPAEFWFVFVETTPPFGIGVMNLGEPEIEHGRMLYRRALAIYRDCTRRNEWPGYPEEPRTITMPPWAFKERAS